jgi:hypothetical protein
LALWTGVCVLPGGSGLAFAATFDVASGDVAGLITAMEAANANGEADVIQLEAGTYTLTVAHNAFRGMNGLPVVTSAITHRRRRRGDDGHRTRGGSAGLPHHRGDRRG